MKSAFKIIQNDYVGNLYLHKDRKSAEERIIEGKTKDLITGKLYSVSSRFAIEENTLELSKVTSSIRNGLLYITIPVKAETPAEEKETNIEIL